MYVYFNLGIEDKKPSVRLVSSSNLLLLLTNPLIRIDKTLGLPEKLLNKCTKVYHLENTFHLHLVSTNNQPKLVLLKPFFLPPF